MGILSIRTVVRVAVIFFFSCTSLAIHAADVTPVEAYASLPSLRNVKMSPDARQIGFITHNEGRSVLMLENIDGTNRVMVPPLDKADIATFYWRGCGVNQRCSWSTLRSRSRLACRRNHRRLEPTRIRSCSSSCIRFRRFRNEACPSNHRSSFRKRLPDS